MDADFVARLFGELKLTLGTLAESVQKANTLREMESRRAEAPRQLVIRATGMVPASGFLPMKFDLLGPDQGNMWQVRRIVVGGLTPVTAAAGRADVFVSAADLSRIGSLAEVGLGDWVDQATNLPLVGSYGKGECFLRHNEELFVIISNGTPGQQYVASAFVENYQEASIMQNWGL